MRTISVFINYEKIAPTVLEQSICHLYPCFISWRDVDEDCFEFTITAREEDVASIERQLAQYV